MLDTADAITLEAEIDVPAERWAGVVLAHPHPTYGGNMHASVTHALFETLPRHGIATLRFNFRGVGSSGGEHDLGLGERLDIVAAIELLSMFVDGPLVLSGYSFGADVSLCVIDPRITGWYAVAPPLRTVSAADFRGRDRSPPQAPRGGRARPVQPSRRGASHDGRVARHRGDVHPRGRPLPERAAVGGRRGLRRVRPLVGVKGRRSAPPGCAKHRLSSGASGAARSEAEAGDED